MPATAQLNRPSLETLATKFGGTIERPYVKGCKVAGQDCDIYYTSNGGLAVTTKDEPYSWRELSRFVRMYYGMPDPRMQFANDNAPIDLWANRASPRLPGGLLPAVIEEFATVQSDVMGVDSGGLAMAAIAVCAAAIPDSIQIQPKQFDPTWLESARLWVAVIGNPSTKKSPLINAATRPLKRIDKDMFRKYAAEKEAFDSLDKDQKRGVDQPRHVRLRLEDTTIEAAQEVLKDSPDGVLLLQDELSGWFGSMDKYSGGGRGAQKDRAFWLQSFNGGSYTVNRVGRGSSMIDNLSVSLLGGIQPDPIRAIANDSSDDGLLQRLFPIVLRPARLGLDVAMPSVAADYDALVERLHGLRKPLRGGMVEVPVRFDAAAQAVWQDVVRRNFEMVEGWESVNKKIAAHIGKLDGLFARLCLVWHCIESTGARPASVIDEDTARRVADFMQLFLFPHALAFYTDILGLSDRQDGLLATAGWILSHKPDRVTIRDVRRGDRIMRAMDNREAELVLEQLDAFRWLDPVMSLRRDSKEWKVNAGVYTVFEDRADQEVERRLLARETIADNLKQAA